MDDVYDDHLSREDDEGAAVLLDPPVGRRDGDVARALGRAHGDLDRPDASGREDAEA